MDYGKIKVTTDFRELAPNYHQNVITDAVWEGYPVAKVDGYFLHMHHLLEGSPIGHIVTIGPLRIRIIDHEAWSHNYIAVRDTHLAWWYIFRHRVQRLIAPIKPRLIMTCAVWGLARWDNGAMPQWDDIHLVRKIGDDERKAIWFWMAFALPILISLYILTRFLPI